VWLGITAIRSNGTERRFGKEFQSAIWILINVNPEIGGHAFVISEDGRRLAV
jgi:hypothetical protein